MVADKLLVYFESEEPIVRRLGAAVVSCWADLPVKFKGKLLERTRLVLDTEPDSDEDLDQQVLALIEAHSNKR